jgi:hypothetical protein
MAQSEIIRYPGGPRVLARPNSPTKQTNRPCLAGAQGEEEMETAIYHEYHHFDGEYFYHWPTWFFWDEIIFVPEDEDEDEVTYFVRIGICRNPYGSHNLIATVETCRGLISIRQETITGNRAVLTELGKIGVDVERVADLLNKEKRCAIARACLAEDSA